MNQLTKIVFIVIVISNISLFSQKREEIEYLSNFDKKELRWGFYLGMNKVDYKFSYKPDFPIAIDSIQAEPTMGFNVGLIGDMRLHRNLSLRLEPGVFYTKKVITFEYLRKDQDRFRDATSLFMYIPLIMQFNANRYKNIRPYVAGGLAYGLNFTNIQGKKTDDNATGVFRSQKHNFFYEIGAGIDFYFYYFKFSPSIRGVFALNNELMRDEADTNSGSVSQWTSPINSMGSTGIFLRLTFQ